MPGPKPVLTAQRCREAYRLRDDGWTAAMIAQHFSVSKRHIERLFHGQLPVPREPYHCREHGDWLYGYCPICEPPHSDSRCSGDESGELVLELEGQEAVEYRRMLKQA